MRFARSLSPALLPIALVVAWVCTGETPPPVPQEEPRTLLAAAFREQRLEWTDEQVGEVVVAAPPWQQPIAEPVPVIAPGSDGAPSAVLATGIPETAMASYTSAEHSLAESDPSCGLSWSVIAAIGRVESNHGRYGGAMLHTDGATRPVIRGIALDGRPGVAVIGDSDGGGLDGDRTYDRAVGPMQFIPTTWRGWAADGNNDGVRDPDNIFDAALAAGRYLCAGDVDTREIDGLKSSIFRYNHSNDYVSAVVAIAKAYRDNESPVIPNPPEAKPVEVVAEAPPAAEAPVVVTTTPPATTTTTPPVSTTESTSASESESAEVTPSTEPSTTDPTKRPRPVVCTVTPASSSATPWSPNMPIVTCKPRTPAPKPETTPTPTPGQ